MTTSRTWFRIASVTVALFGVAYASAWAADDPQTDHGGAEVTDSAAMHATEPGHGADHEGGHAGSTNPVTFGPDLAIVTLIIFLLLLTVLGKFAWGPIIAAIDKREATIADQIAEAHRSNDEARRLLADHEAKLAGAAAEVKQILDQSRKDAEHQKQMILAEAQTAAQSEKQRAVREIEAAKNAALADLAQTSVNTAVQLAGNIVQRQLTADDHAQLISDALREFPSNN